jgi:hypothetical protein
MFKRFALITLAALALALPISLHVQAPAPAAPYRVAETTGQASSLTGTGTGATVTTPALGQASNLGTVTTATTTTSTSRGVVLPWGDLLSSILSGVSQVLAVLLLAAATAVVTMLPSWVQELVRPALLTMRKDQLFDKLASTIVAGTKGAIAGKTVTVPIANDMVRQVVQMAIDRGGPAVIAFAGGHVEALAEKALGALQEKGVIPAAYSIADAKVAVAGVEVPSK